MFFITVHLSHRAGITNLFTVQLVKTLKPYDRKSNKVSLKSISNTLAS